jgi:transposase
LGTYPAKLARTELGTFPDYDLAQRYRDWLEAA